MSVHFSSEDHTWETPAALFAVLNAEFAFDLDVCATADTAKCSRFYSPEQNGLAMPWQGTCWMNPPYGREIVKWIGKAHLTAARALGSVVALVPARVDTAWWWNYARHGEVRFLPGRLRFGEAASGAPFPSAVIVFRAGLPGPSTAYWNWQAASAGRETLALALG